MPNLHAHVLFYSNIRVKVYYEKLQIDEANTFFFNTTYKQF